MSTSTCKGNRKVNACGRQTKSAAWGSTYRKVVYISSVGDDCVSEIEPFSYMVNKERLNRVSYVREFFHHWAAALGYSNYWPGTAKKLIFQLFWGPCFSFSVTFDLFRLSFVLPYLIFLLRDVRFLMCLCLCFGPPWGRSLLLLLL